MSESPILRVVIDTNVLVAAVRSRQGASFLLINSIPSTEFQHCLSVSLYAEWLDVLTRPEHVAPGRASGDATAFVRYLASEAHLQDVHYLWRPFLPDSDDDMVLELAFAAGCEYIITHNERDFHGIDRFGIIPISPRAFLGLLRNEP